MRWRYREGRAKALLLIGLTAAAFLIFLCPETKLTGKVYGQFFPTAAFCMDALAYGEKSMTAGGKMMDMVADQLPLYSYSISYFGDGMMNQYYKEYVEILMQEAKEGTGGEIQEIQTENLTEAESGDHGQEGMGEAESVQEDISGNGVPERIVEDDRTEGTPESEEIRLNEENSTFMITDGSKAEADTNSYQNLIHTEKVQTVLIENYQEFEALAGKFYTVDASTYTNAEELNAQRLVSVDMTIKKDGEGPQILIYHTHAHEEYADFAEGNSSATVVGVGEQLAKILREEYGYQVLHHTEAYDGDRDYAYSCALPALEQILKENPSIQVVIDLHRDSMAADKRLVTQIAGQPTARFMFFNGLSRVRDIGEISYLPNENLQGNLAFSFQMQKVCEEYYPGLTRKIYLKGYRYNMHLLPRTLLVELGAQNNTAEEALNACGPLARALDMVLSGE